MKSKNLRAVLTLLLSLSAIASFAQKERDSLVQLKISEYRIFEECCIREDGLEKDTSRLLKDIGDLKLQIKAKQQEQLDDRQIAQQQSVQMLLTKDQLQKTEKAYAYETKIKLRYKKFIIVLTPAAFLIGAYLGHQLR